MFQGEARALGRGALVVELGSRVSGLGPRPVLAAM